MQRSNHTTEPGEDTIRDSIGEMPGILSPGSDGKNGAGSSKESGKYFFEEDLEEYLDEPDEEEETEDGLDEWDEPVGRSPIRNTDGDDYEDDDYEDDYVDGDSYEEELDIRERARRVMAEEDERERKPTNGELLGTAIRHKGITIAFVSMVIYYSVLYILSTIRAISDAVLFVTSLIPLAVLGVVYMLLQEK